MAKSRKGARYYIVMALLVVVVASALLTAFLTLGLLDPLIFLMDVFNISDIWRPTPHLAPQEDSLGPPLLPLAWLGSAITFLLSTVATVTTILLSWRQERRHSDEFKLKIAQLELELAKTKKQVETS